MASAAPGAIPLALHQPVDRTIALRQADTLRIELPPDHYALVVVTTAAGSLEGTLVAPDGSSVVQAASRVFRVGGIPFSVHADAAGVATLQVLCSGGDRCRYSAVLDAVRPWDDEAAMQMRGERALIDGEAARLGSGDLRAADRHYADAVAAFRQTPDRSGLTVAVVLRGQVLRQLDELPQALDQYREARALYRDSGDRASEARTLRGMGDVQRLQGDIEACLASLTEALEVARSYGDRPGEAAARFSLGVAHDGLGEWQAALDDKAESLRLWREEHNAVEEAGVTASIAVTYNRMGQGRDAVRHILDALAMMKAAGTPDSEVRTHLNNAGVIYATAGEFETALRYYEQSLSMARRLNLPVAGTLNNIGFARYASGDVSAALENYAQALPLFRAARDLVGEAA